MVPWRSYSVPPTEGYGKAIVLPEINADHFEIKTNLLQLVQANPFNGRENENPHAHINSFKRITSTLRFRNVPNDVIKLMMFPYSLEGAAKTWYEKEPPNSILTWEDLVTKFVNQFFPPSKTTHLKNEISRFTQKFEETFSEAWERFKELLRACPHHGFTDYANIQASVCATTGTYNQVNPPNRVSNQIPPPGFAPVQNNGQNRFNQNHVQSYKRNNDQMLRNMQNQINSLKGDLKNEIQNMIKSQQAVMMNQQTTFQNNLQNMICGLFQNQASTLGTLPSNTIPNPKGEMKAITTRSGVAYKGPSIPTNPSPKKVVERETEETTDKEQTNFQGSTAQIPPPVIPISIPGLSLPKPNIPYPSRRDDQKSRDKASNQMEKIFQIFQDLRFDISFADALLLMPRFAPTIKSLLMNKEKLLELAKIPLNENCSAMLLKKLPEKLGDPGKFLIPCNFPGMDVCHALADLGASINLMPLSIWKKLSLPDLTPTRMTLELADRSITYPKGLAEDVFVKVGKFHFPTDFVVVDFEADPRVPLILGRSFLRTGRALIDVYGEEITLRVDNEAVTFNLDQTTRYSSTNDKSVNQIDIIDAVCEEYAPEFLGFSNSSGGNPTPTSEPFTSEFILEEIEAYLKDDSISPEIDHADCDPEEDICLIEKLLNNDPFQLPPMDLKQSEVTEAKSSIEEPLELELKDLPSHLEYAFLEENDKLPVIIAKVIKKEVLKLLDAGMIYPISDSPWVSPVHCVPKKGGITVVANEENELILTRLVTGWRVCIDYRKLNEATRKDHFPLPFMDQMIERLAGNEFYCFLDGFSGYFQIPIDPRQENNLLSHARMELSHTDACHLGEVPLYDVISKLPHPTTVKGIRSFLGHAGFYRRFIKDFSKISRPMTHLLEKNTPFIFSEDCILAFQTLKKKLTEAPILIAPNWDQPFEIMCDASDYAIGAVLGQRIEKHFRPIHYASKTMTEAETNYTTTEKEMLAVVYAFEKFRSYLIMNKSVVYTDHSALKYLFNKKDAKARLLRWVLLLQEFDFKVIDTKGAENYAADHLSRLENPYENVFDPKEITETFPLETLSVLTSKDQILLFNSRLKIFSGKLKSRWSGPFTITEVYPYGTAKLSHADGSNFKVNCHRFEALLGSGCITIGYPGPPDFPYGQLNSGILPTISLKSLVSGVVSRSTQALIHCTDKSKITRKQSKASKPGHENQKSTKLKPKALANFHLQGPILQFPKVIYNLKKRKEREGPNV
ncbi:reverse transcriptase domain-containing protein [Tanacetum coccineum]